MGVNRKVSTLFCFSYGIIIDIIQEEFLANWISLYGRDVIELLDNIMRQIKGPME